MSLTRETVKTTMHARVECKFHEEGFNQGHGDHWQLIFAETEEDLKGQVPSFWSIVKRWESFEPATVISHGIDGHKYEYRIIGFFLDGTVRTSSWDAQHQDDCRCHTSEDW